MIDAESPEIGYADRTWTNISRECLSQAIENRPACHSCSLIPRDLVPCKVWDAVKWLKENKPEGLYTLNKEKDNQDKVFETIKENPGSTFTDIHGLCGISSFEKLKDYFRIMEDEGMIISVKKWKYKYWYPV